MTDRQDARIRELNDEFRTSFNGGRVVMTESIAELAPELKMAIIEKVQLFVDFSPENDPYGHHDFGNFDFDNEPFYWKIDYYDAEGEGGSEDASDPDQTMRVLTIMRAEEY